MRKNILYYACILISTVMLSCLMFSGSVQAEDVSENVDTKVAGEPSPYDDITWETVNKERKEKDKNFLVKMYTHFFRKKEIDTIRGEKITVLQTMTQTDDEDGDVRIVHIISDNLTQ